VGEGRDKILTKGKKMGKRGVGKKMPYRKRGYFFQKKIFGGQEGKVYRQGEKDHYKEGGKTEEGTKKKRIIQYRHVGARKNF